jgi:hypothetical protein
MSDASVIAIVMFLVRLEAENRVLRKELFGAYASRHDSAVAEQVQRLSDIPQIAAVLQGSALDQLPELLDKLSTFPLG